MTTVKAVLYAVPIEGKIARRWFPLVPGFPGQFVIPEKWVEAHCPNGFKSPDGAIAAARRFLGEMEE